MNRIISFICCAIVVLFTSCGATGQLGNTEYSSQDKKAIKLFERGLDELNLKQMQKAEALFKEALAKDDQFTEVYLTLAEMYLARGDEEAAKPNLVQVTKLSPRKYMIAYFYLGEINLSEGNYDEALELLTGFVQNNKKASPAVDRANRSIQNCYFGIEAMKNPVEFKPINFGETINSPFPEYYPTLTVDESELLFTRRIENASAFQGMHEDFFVSSNSGESWGTAQNLRGVNSLMNEGAPSLSADGKLIFFTACALYDDYGAGRSGFGSCDIFYSYKQGKSWSPAKNLGGEVNTGVWESQPSFSADGKTLYFIRGKRSGEGISQQDIYYSELTEQGTWTKAQKIPGAVNTPYVEESVFIHPDGETLYFSSDGHPGMGGLDLFMSKKHSDGSWGTPVNLGYPINTAGDENSLLVSAGGELAVFASDRPGGYGDLDLYHFKLPKNVLPAPVTYAKGLIYDDANFRPLGANFELIDLATGKSVALGTSDETSGDFLIPLPVGKEYMVNVSREGYMFHSENFSLTRETKGESYELNIPLKKIKEGNAVVLQNVFFDTDSYELKPASQSELNKLVSFLNLNPQVNIEIGGHTDNVGSVEDNLLLSENRANSVRTFLLNAGVPQDRVTAKGYGESVPVSDNETSEGRAKNRRTEFKIR